MNNQKVLWEKLAKEKAQYYMLGRTVSAQDFRKTGEIDYKQFIFDDTLIKSAYPDFANVTILDIGCGIGRMIEFMAKDFKKVIGTDISSEMIRQGEERLKNFKNVKLLENDGETLPLPRASIDFVFSYWVFKHVKTKQMVKRNFQEAYRVLKPNKLFKAAIRSKKPVSRESWWSGIQFDETSAKELYEDTGFSLLKQSYIPESYDFWLWLKKL